MQNGNSVLKTVRAALERESHINLHRWPIHLDMTDDSVLVMEGDMESVAAKKRALELAGSLADIRGVVDRLHVAPSEHKTDGEILDVLETFLLDTRDLKNCAIRVIKKGQTVTVQENQDDDASGDLLVSVKDGVVTLDGWVISLSHKRIAGALAWWVPGGRDVVDALEVLPPERDSDDEITDALSLVLEMDPMIRDATQIRVQTDNFIVTLQGLVGTEREKDRAEQDAWCLFAVDNVVNRLSVGAA